MRRINERTDEFIFKVGLRNGVIFNLEEVSLPSGRTLLCKSTKVPGGSPRVVPVCIVEKYLGNKKNQEVYFGKFLTTKDLIEISKSETDLEIQFSEYQKNMLKGYLW